MSRSPSIARLRAVTALVDTGSIAAAARRLNVSESAVSQSVHALEQAHGVILFNRSGGRLTATAAAREIAGLGAQMEALGTRAEAVLARKRGESSTRLSIGLGNAMPGMALIRGFLDRYPEIEVRIEMNDFDGILEGVLDERLDVALLPDVPEDSRLRRRSCVPQDVVAIVPPTHHLAGRERVSLRDLSRERLIVRAEGSATRREVLRAFQRARIALRPALELSSREGVCEAVANGLGVGFVWRHATSRRDGLRRIAVQGMNEVHHEVAFALADNGDHAVEAFLTFAQTHGPRLGGGPAQHPDG